MPCLKSLLPASLLALALPVAAPAHTSDGLFPLFSAIMAPRHAPVLMRAEYLPSPILRREIGRAPSIPRPFLRLHCAVAGTPVEFPDDLHIWSDHAVAAGTVASWSVTGTSMHGSVVLPALAPGQFYFVSHALPGGVEAGHPCTAFSY